MTAAVTPGMGPAAAFKARQAKIGELEKAASDDKNGVRADVVTLFAGGQYHLYTYKKYTDIRIVFAPEKAVAFFGGDPDNFEFPRYDLDVCFMRVYENGKPLDCKDYLNWSANGSAENELVFVSGHPGRTTRQNAVAELEFLRDTGYPTLLSRLNRLEVLIGAWTERSAANRQKGEDELFGIQNSRKARIGGLAGLLDPKLMGRKVAEEARLKKFIAESSDAEVKKAADAFEKIAAAQKLSREMLTDAQMIAGGGAFNTSYFRYAQSLLRAAAERAKPNGERLAEYSDARLPRLEQALASKEPHYDDFETLKLADSLTAFANAYGAADPLVQQVLAGKSPRQRAYELVSGTKMKDAEYRKKLYEGGPEAVAAANDPMVEVAKLIDDKARATRKELEAKIDEPKRQAYSALAKARYAMDGANSYPDATFTLRLSYGTVKGYTDDGKAVPAFTTMAGMYERSQEQGNKYPFELPKRWFDKKSALDLNTPLNFVSTNDIIGGNSGSPVFNKKGEVVGLIFDGNIQSLVLDFIFDQDIARAVSVDSRAIVEALTKVYGATELVAELRGGK